MADIEAGGTQEVEIQAPKVILYGSKVLGLISSFSWIFGSIWNFINCIAAWTCILAAVLALVLAGAIWCVEAAVLVTWGPCAPYTKKVAEKTENFKIWQKTLFYIGGGCLTYFLCPASLTANCFGFLMTIGAGIGYGYCAFQHRSKTGELP